VFLRAVQQVSNCQPWVCIILAAHLCPTATIRRDICAAWFSCSPVFF